MPAATTPQKIQEWEDRIRIQKQSGQAAKAWCLQNNIAYHCFKYWRSRLKHRTPLVKASFKELPLIEQSSHISIDYHFVKVQLPKNLDPMILMNYLRALKGEP